MKFIILILLFLALIPSVSLPQSTDTAGIVNNLKSQLEKGELTSQQILIDKDYMEIHYAESFRYLIKDYAPKAEIKITNENEPGEKIKVTCEVKDESGNPVSDALVYIYQTDNRGYYGKDSPHILANEGDYRHARLFGYLYTDSSGKINIETIKPVGYPKSTLPRHIHIVISKEGYNYLGTELLFDNDERLSEEQRKRALNEGFLISSFDNSKDIPSITYTLTIKK